MKRIILLMLVIVLSMPALTQISENPVNKDFFNSLTKQFAHQDGFSASLITSDMFDLYIKKRNIDKESPVFDALKKLDKIMVVSQSSLAGDYNKKDFDSSDVKTKNNALIEGVHSSFLNYYNKNNYTLFKTEKRMGEDVKVYLKKSASQISSLALVTSSSVSTNLVELQGDIDLTTVAELSKALNLRGLENLYKIDNSNAFYSGYFGSSPERWTRFNEDRYDEMIARKREMAERQRELTDEQRLQFEKQAQIQAQKQLEMAEKYREMAEKYQRQPIFLSYPGDTNTVYYLDGKKVKADMIKKMDKDKIESVSIEKDKKKDDRTTIRIKTK